MSGSQVDTQPMEENLPSMSCSPPNKDGAWGWLVSISEHQLTQVLTPVKREMTKVGRDNSCDLMMTQTVFTGSTDEDLQLGKVSFQLHRERANLVLEDKSMNGMKVGKDNRHCLDQEDIISILHVDFEVFLFISEARLMQMYPRSVDSK